MARRRGRVEVFAHDTSMIIVDSNTWADFFNDAPGAHVQRLEAALMDEDDLAVLPIIVTEVLQGFKSESGFRQARGVLLRLPVIQPPLPPTIEGLMMALPANPRATGLTGQQAHQRR